jgi:hypothetical protein
MKNNIASTDLGNSLNPINNSLAQISKATTILLDQNNGTYNLMKYEGHKTEFLDRHTHRMSRDNFINTSIHDMLLGSRRKNVIPKGKQETQKAMFNLFGTHKIDFTFDNEFGFYLPSADNTDLFLKVGRELRDGTIEKTYDGLDVYIGNEEVGKKLKELVLPDYYENIITPFLNEQSTNLEMPTWKKRNLLNPFKTNKWKLLDKFEKETKKLDQGDFVYVGSQNEVYLLGLARDYNGLAMQGTYLTSTKPMFYFSNNYLSHFSRHYMERPLFKGDGSFNCAKYRGSSAPGFQDKPFIFTQMGRTQNCKNTIFTGEPDLITGDLDEALAHFKLTKFGEYDSVVEKYAKTMSHIGPSLEKHIENDFFY